MQWLQSFGLIFVLNWKVFSTCPSQLFVAIELGKRAADHRAFLLANHGPVITGTNLIDAVNNTEELEETAKLVFLLEGKAVRYLTENEISELNRSRK